MGDKLLKIADTLYSVGMLTLLGALFNTAIALSSLYIEGIQILVAGLTGYGLYNVYKLFQGRKNADSQGDSNQGRE